MRNIAENPIIIVLPVVLTRDTVQGLVMHLFRQLKSRPGCVCLDFMQLKKIQVGGVTVLCNLISLCRQMGIRVEHNAADFCDAFEFVKRSGLLAFSEAGRQAPPTCPQFLPIKTVRYERSHAYVHFELVPWLASNLGLETGELGTLRVCFEEIFNNIRDHSSIEVGCSAAHYDEKSGDITICVADFGVGIPGRVRLHRPELTTDQAAIAMACVEGFTTQTTPKNMGAGLHVLIRNVVEKNRGTVDIISGQGGYTCSAATKKGSSKRVGRSARATYPGTMIKIVLQKNKFVPDDIDEEDFTWE
ncbi:hypothetical protein F2P44_31170 [Massilia sp. CCM 8695]|uniref:STAS domain-containing protein n=1 Tax=Massilia frigida TaxID=2609281 RepID=A0ABX0NK60_9BURK|nr:hypothetical protein [Massilia frigida]NHZ83695.1 hypothetical protein [Massilia frigida]